MSSIVSTLLDDFGPDAKAWVFTLTRALTADESARVTSELDRFLESWAAHKQPLPSKSQLIDSQILLVVAESFASGCSIDSLFKEVERIAAANANSLAPVGAIVIHDTNGELKLLNRAEFRQSHEKGEISAETPVLNSAIASLNEIREGLFIPLGRSPFARLVGGSLQY